jgi:hypothetical protein
MQFAMMPLQHTMDGWQMVIWQVTFIACKDDCRIHDLAKRKLKAKQQ